MKKTIKEMIEVMEAYTNGAIIEYSNPAYNTWEAVTYPSWDWCSYDYRVKESKQKVTIEKWLLSDMGISSKGLKVVVETSDIDDWLSYYPNAKKLKLIESYEVEI